MLLFDRISLKFAEKSIEQHYRNFIFEHAVCQLRLSLVVGIVVVLTGCLLDIGILFPEANNWIWYTRCALISSVVWLLPVSYLANFKRYREQFVFTSCISIFLALLAFIKFSPPILSTLYFPSLVVLIFFAFNFTGLTFVSTILLGFIFLLGYNALMIIEAFNSELFTAHNYYLLTTIVFAASMCYHQEKYRREYYVVQRELERETIKHKRLASQDPLTKLPNRTRLLDHIEFALNQATMENTYYAGFFIDLDKFKTINDEHGHGVGDQVLMEVAHRLRLTARMEDVVSRIGGDEFFVLAQGVSNRHQAEQYRKRLLHAINLPMDEISGKPNVGASIGVSLIPNLNMDVESVIEQADKDMYRYKRNKSDIVH